METNTHDHTVDLETALDFVNTLQNEDGDWFDHLGSIDQAFDWLHGHGLIHDGPTDRPTTDPRTDERSLRRIRRIRAALRELVDATYESRPPRLEAIGDVNRALRAKEVIQLVPSEDGLRLAQRCSGDPVDEALADLTEPIVREIAAGRPERLRACASDTCRWVFYDDSRTGRRRWCDMASCGNRAKAARHRARIKGGAPEATASGATVKEPAHDVGGGRLVATVTDPDGNVLGLLQDR